MAAQEAQQIIRLVETNLDGRKEVGAAIRSIDGISFMLANAIVKVGHFQKKKIGELSEEESKRLEAIIAHPENYNIPVWMLNRRKEPATGENKHLTASTLEFAQRMDLNEMKKNKTYKGVRHSLGLPVRGQRTRSSFRHNKSVGVVKKKAQPGAAKPAAEGKK
jgi:small subunit ribosomal protein S13